MLYGCSSPTSLSLSLPLYLTPLSLFSFLPRSLSLFVIAQAWTLSCSVEFSLMGIILTSVSNCPHPMSEALSLSLFLLRAPPIPSLSLSPVQPSALYPSSLVILSSGLSVALAWLSRILFLLAVFQVSGVRRTADMEVHLPLTQTRLEGTEGAGGGRGRRQPHRNPVQGPQTARQGITLPCRLASFSGRNCF